MGDIYASALGTTVLRHCAVPQRPSELDGEVVVLVEAGGALDPHHLQHPVHAHNLVQELNATNYCDVCQLQAIKTLGTAYRCASGCDWDCCQMCFNSSGQVLDREAAARMKLQAALGVHGELVASGVRYEKEQARWRVRFATHAAAEAVVALTEGAALAGAVAIFCYHNGRPYAERGCERGRATPLPPPPPRALPPPSACIHVAAQHAPLATAHTHAPLVIVPPLPF